MTYEMKPLSCNPAKLTGLSEKLIVSHYENNYGGAVKRLNAITAQLELLDFAAAPVFVINGLKREELIASNSMILHELYFDGLGSQGEPDKGLRNALIRDFGSAEKWQAQFAAMGKALGGGSGWVLLAYVFASRQKTRESMGRGSYLLSRRSKPNSRTGHVRALLSHGLRRKGRSLRRCLHEQHQLGKYLASFCCRGNPLVETRI